MTNPNVHTGDVEATIGILFGPDAKHDGEIRLETWHRGHDEVFGTGDVCIEMWDHPHDDALDIDLRLPHEDARQLGLRLIEAASVAEEYENVE